MPQSLRVGVTGFVMLLAVVAVHVHAGDIPASEYHKIEALIQHVEHLQDAVFIRNNKAYSATTAAKFLRGKWEGTLDEIKTAKDFIEKVASVSSTSGQPYRIRFKDGREMPSGAYLGTVLQQLEKPS